MDFKQSGQVLFRDTGKTYRIEVNFVVATTGPPPMAERHEVKVSEREDGSEDFVYLNPAQSQVVMNLFVVAVIKGKGT